jgi:hypothetical protein
MVTTRGDQANLVELLVCSALRFRPARPPPPALAALATVVLTATVVPPSTDKELATVAGIELGADFLPLDVKVETVLGLALSLVGALFNGVKFMPVDGSAAMNAETWDRFWDEPNFRIHNHRAAALKKRLDKAAK